VVCVHFMRMAGPVPFAFTWRPALLLFRVRGKGGDIVAFTQQREGLSFHDALAKLSDEWGYNHAWHTRRFNEKPLLHAWTYRATDGAPLGIVGALPGRKR